MFYSLPCLFCGGSGCLLLDMSFCYCAPVVCLSLIFFSFFPFLPLGLFSIPSYSVLRVGYGCVIEAPPAHPGLMGLVLPWNDALTHRYSMYYAVVLFAYIRQSSIVNRRSSIVNRQCFLPPPFGVVLVAPSCFMGKAPLVLRPVPCMVMSTRGHSSMSLLRTIMQLISS